MSNITLNVGGKIFQVNYETIINIPYFKNMFEDCGIPNEIIYVNRPPNIFKHILGLTMEPKYPYPLKYEFELDFFGIVYDKNMLYKGGIGLVEPIGQVGSTDKDIHTGDTGHVCNISSVSPEGPVRPVNSVRPVRNAVSFKKSSNGPYAIWHIGRSKKSSGKSNRF